MNLIINQTKYGYIKIEFSIRSLKSWLQDNFRKPIQHTVTKMCYC